jgi:hypothetical protein
MGIYLSISHHRQVGSLVYLQYLRDERRSHDIEVRVANYVWNKNLGSDRVTGKAKNAQPPRSSKYSTQPPTFTAVVRDVVASTPWYPIFEEVSSFLDTVGTLFGAGLRGV